MKTIDERLIDVEICLTDQERTINELNDECIRMNKLIEQLSKQVKLLTESLKESPVKPLSEETRPPHY